MGKICPMIAKWHMNILFTIFMSLKKIWQIKNGIKPLMISKHRTINAKNLFPVRKTLVAPTLPEPIFLISPKPNNFVIINAKGNDPII